MGRAASARIHSEKYDEAADDEEEVDAEIAVPRQLVDSGKASRGVVALDCTTECVVVQNDHGRSDEPEKVERGQTVALSFIGETSCPGHPVPRSRRPK